MMIKNHQFTKVARNEVKINNGNIKQTDNY